MNDYLVPASRGESKYEEKRSIFLGHLKYVQTEEEARSFIADIKKEYHDARHNCWCYIIHGGAERYSDDGEPQGTAGIPMLEVFRREGVSDFVCVVTRYFGGILLGAGGLLRAYTKAAKDSLDAAGIAEIKAWQSTELNVPYSFVDRLKSELTFANGVIKDIAYASDVTLTVLIPEEKYETFAAHIFDISAGRILAEKGEKEFFPQARE